MVEPQLFTIEQAATYLSFSKSALRTSHTTGTLVGVDPPKRIKMGGSVRYRKCDLDEWLGQFLDKEDTDK